MLLKSNVWLLNHYAVSPDMAGGTRHYDFAEELVKRGYNVTIFASSFSHKKKMETKLFGGEKHKIENADGVKFVWIKTFPYQKNDWRRIINMLNFMVSSYCLGRRIINPGENIQKPNVIIGSSVHLFTVLSAYFLAKRYRAKFIMEVRDLWPQSAVDIGVLSEKGLTTKTLRVLEKYLYKKAEQIIILSPLTKDYLLSLRINSHKIQLIPNGVNVSRFGTPDAPDRKCDRNFRVVYTGSIGVVNALAPVLKAAEIIQNSNMHIKFIFVGAGVEKPKLMEKSKKIGLGNVEFHKPVSKSDIPSVLKTADVGLVCENRILYGSSNKLMDYMAAGKPVIFSTPANHNTTKEARCGISVSPGNSEALADAIVKLYNMSEDDRIQMGKRGREYVEKYHSIPVLVDKLEGVIREVARHKL